MQFDPHLSHHDELHGGPGPEHPPADRALIVQGMDLRDPNAARLQGEENQLRLIGMETSHRHSSSRAETGTDLQGPTGEFSPAPIS